MSVVFAFGVSTPSTKFTDWRVADWCTYLLTNWRTVYTWLIGWLLKHLVYVSNSDEYRYGMHQLIDCWIVWLICDFSASTFSTHSCWRTASSQLVILWWRRSSAYTTTQSAAMSSRRCSRHISAAGSSTTVSLRAVLWWLTMAIEILIQKPHSEIETTFWQEA